MKVPYEFSFDTVLERGEKDTEIHVVARVEGVASNAGFPDEPCRLREVTIIRTEYRGEPLSEEEQNELHSQAMDRLCYH